MNGEKVDSASAKSGLVIPSNGAKYFFIGADTSGSGAPEYQMKEGYVALARISSQVFSDDEVAASYTNAMGDGPAAKQTVRQALTAAKRVVEAGQGKTIAMQRGLRSPMPIPLRWCGSKTSVPPRPTSMPLRSPCVQHSRHCRKRIAEMTGMAAMAGTVDQTLVARMLISQAVRTIPIPARTSPPPVREPMLLTV